MSYFTKQTLKPLVYVLMMAQVWMPMQAGAKISKMPPTVQTVAPNVMFTLDDSGSMGYQEMPDNVSGADGYGADFETGATTSIKIRRFRSYAVNTIYYNPSTTYDVWVEPDGSLYPPADPLAVKSDPVVTTPTINIKQAMSSGAYHATYYKYTGGGACPAKPSPVAGAATGETVACYTKVEIKSGATYPKAATRTDCGTGATCSYNQEIQNFANWYQFWRSRILLARGGIGIAFAKQGTDLRVGWGAINKSGVIVSKVRNDFDTANRTAFFNFLYTDTAPGGGTPLQNALDKVGQYFQDTSINGPWQNKIGTANVSNKINQYTCRQNFNILMTDGYWNGTIPTTTAATADYNNVNGPTHVYGGLKSPAPTYNGYKAAHPYKDVTQKGSLANIAMYYWSRDLRTDMANNVPLGPVVRPDEAYWQHLVNFTVGLGVDGSLAFPTAFTALQTNLLWPKAVANDPTAVDDLWHAAVNSRGQYFSAKTPKQFSASLDGALNSISASSGSVGAVGTSNMTLTADSKIYISTYDGGNWSGRLRQKTLNATTGVPNADADWDTNTSGQIPAFGVRNIVSSNATGIGGIDFNPAQIAATDMTMFNSFATNNYPGLTGDHLVNYIRGDQTQEGTEADPGQLRRRTSGLLGDLVNSDPQYLKEGRDEGYIFLPTGAVGKTTYRTFLKTKKSRAGMVYVGSNDGMLHGFETATGKETFAFIPREVISKLPQLTKPGYRHDFFVDGTPTIGDAVIGSDWRTILVGTTGAGGKSVFAIDVTNPINPNGTTGLTKDKVLWELNATTPSVDNDLGYTIGNPQIGRLKNGDWVTIFGNGYESTRGSAVLYVVKLATGQVTKIDVGATGTTAATANGLSTPKLNIAGDGTIVGAYAGDLQGNMWKFQFPTTGVASSSLLFTSTLTGSASDRRQPITTQPQLFPHPTKPGLIVTFGTGKIFAADDANSTAVESIYGIWDNNSGRVLHTQLAEQTLTLQNTKFYQISENPVDWNTKKGWFIDLKVSSGERVIRNPQMMDDQFIVTTLIPNSDGDACLGGARSATFILSPLTGSAPGYATSDTNNDGVIDAEDNNTYGAVIGAGTYGTTIIRTGNRQYKVYQGDALTGDLAGTGTGLPCPPGKKCDCPPGDSSCRALSAPSPTVRLWRQIINKPTN